jgi:hypothetical protein
MQSYCTGNSDALNYVYFFGTQSNWCVQNAAQTGPPNIVHTLPVRRISNNQISNYYYIIAIACDNIFRVQLFNSNQYHCYYIKVV